MDVDESTAESLGEDTFITFGTKHVAPEGLEYTTSSFVLQADLANEQRSQRRAARRVELVG